MGLKLGVIGDTRHHLDAAGRLSTHDAVASQLEQWASMFDEVILLVPLWPGPPPPGFRAYRSDKFTILPLRPAGGPAIWDKVRLASRIPSWTIGIARLARRVDALHLRAPCNVALFGVLAAPLTRRHRAAIYAGNWHGYFREPLTYAAQRRWLRSPAFGGPVTVYTAEPAPAAPHVVPFFSPSFTRDEWEADEPAFEAKLAAIVSAGLPSPVHLVTVGHLVPNKGHATVIDAVRSLRQDGMDVRLDVVGDGPQRGALDRRRRDFRLDDSVTLHGRVPLDEVRALYRRAHVNVLASHTEGYPKVVAEGMVHGAVPVTSRFPLSDLLLGRGERGATFAAGDAVGLARAIGALLRDPARLGAMMAAGRAYAGTVTLDDYGERVHAMLEEHWGISLPRPEVPARC